MATGMVFVPHSTYELMKATHRDENSFSLSNGRQCIKQKSISGRPAKPFTNTTSMQPVFL